jgi:hypothetical protein
VLTDPGEGRWVFKLGPDMRLCYLTDGTEEHHTGEDTTLAATEMRNDHDLAFIRYYEGNPRECIYKIVLVKDIKVHASDLARKKKAEQT